MNTATERPRLSNEQLEELLSLTRDADSVELKLTVADTDFRSAVTALEMDPLAAQIRQVYFFDTPDLALNQQGIVVRARRNQQREGDSVVKLRPVVPSELPSQLRKSPNLTVEVDAMPGGFVCSASLKNETANEDVMAAVRGLMPLRKLYSKEQRAFLRDHTTDIRLKNLSILGPILVLKLRFRPKQFDSRKMVSELWIYPDGSRILELSTKCLPNEAFQVAAELRAFLSSRGIDLTSEQHTKTKTALEFFSRNMAEAAA